MAPSAVGVPTIGGGFHRHATAFRQSPQPAYRRWTDHWPAVRRLRGSEHFLLSPAGIRQLLVHGDFGRYAACVTGQSCSRRATRLPLQTVRKHRYASDCYQNAQALVAWHIALFSHCRFNVSPEPANRPFQLPSVLC